MCSLINSLIHWWRTSQPFSVQGPSEFMAFESLLTRTTLERSMEDAWVFWNKISLKRNVHRMLWYNSPPNRENCSLFLLRILWKREAGNSKIHCFILLFKSCPHASHSCDLESALVSFSVQYRIAEKWAALSFCLSLQHSSTYCYSVCCLCDYIWWRRGEEGTKGINPKALCMTLKARVIWPCLFVQVPLPQVPGASCTLITCHSPGWSFRPLPHLSGFTSPLPTVPAPLPSTAGPGSALTPCNCETFHLILSMKFNRWHTHTACISFLGWP